jgi:hypothetical protein
MDEPRLLKGGEVDFKLRSNRHIPPEAWQSGGSKWWSSRPAKKISGSQWVMVLIVFTLLCLWMGACKRSDDLLTFKTSDGKTLKLTKQEALSMYIAGAGFSWDATKNHNPPEPQIPKPDTGPTSSAGFVMDAPKGK